MSSPPSSNDADLSHRPPMVQECLRKKIPIYYFGLGSNMSRSHLESRSFDGKKIEIMSMEPAVVPNYRLAFNLPAYLPLEPGMGSLEQIQVDHEGGIPHSVPLYPYSKKECHGALIQLAADDYEKVMITEGVSGTHFTVRNYHEVVVTAVPYDKAKPPVQAVVLSVYPHVKLRQDVAPSARYMQILRDGAKELDLASCYQEFLNTHPVQNIPPWLMMVALPNCLFTLQLYFSKTYLTRQVTRLQYNMMYLVYACPTSSAPKRWLSHALQGFLLLPGAVLVLGLIAYRAISGTEHPLPVQHFLVKLKLFWNRKEKD